MKVPTQLSGALRGGRFQKHNWYGTIFPPSTLLDGFPVWHTYEGHLAFTYDADNVGGATFIAPQMASVSVIDLTRWTLRVKQWRVTSGAWSSAAYRYKVVDDPGPPEVFHWVAVPAIAQSSFNKTFSAGFPIIDNDNYDDVLVDANYLPDERNVLLGDQIIWPGDGEVYFVSPGRHPAFVDDSPELLERSLDGSPGPQRPLGLYFYFHRGVVVDDGLRFRIQDSETIEADGFSPYYQGGVSEGHTTSPAYNAFAPYVNKVTDDRLSLKSFVPAALAYPHGDPDHLPTDWEITTSPLGISLLGDYNYYLQSYLDVETVWNYS